MGSVWVADHLSLGSQVAVKFMAPEIAQSAAFAERFRREAMTAAQLKSPHVAQVFDRGVTEAGVPYIVMELLEGEDLKSRIHRLGPMSLHELACIVRQVARALGRAHQLGIVHRDIKPENIFLTDLEGEGELFVKVLDFGVAKQPVSCDQDMTSTGSSFGTPLYMSPEQLLSAKHVDFRADLWALGVVGYYAITGRVPFAGETLGALSVAIHAGVFTLPSVMRREVPHAFDAWVTRALQRDPAARFGSAREMAGALDQALFGLALAPTLAAGGLAAPMQWPQPFPPAAWAAQTQVPDSAGPPHSGGQARTFRELVLPRPRAGRGRAGFRLAAGAALAGAAALGLTVFFKQGDLQAQGSPAAERSASLDAPGHQATPPEPPLPAQAAPSEPPLRAQAAPSEPPLPTQVTPLARRAEEPQPAPTSAPPSTPPSRPTASLAPSPALPAPVTARRAAPPKPGPAATTSARAAVDRIGF
ncbi:protein kinase domain-containing protein [Sorangium sp. So ce296]|uniref:serine/threonine-protein kinase n=1 Tax=Sorangium sp. So ce296 TaxID=3133296 RepID=UPI003F646C13